MNTLQSTNKDTTSLSVTVYSDFGAVKEDRKISLHDNINMIQYMDVGSKIDTNSLLIGGVKIHELNYDYDLANKQALLEKYLDRNVFLKSKTGELSECRLLSVHEGLVLENVQTKEIYLDPEQELVLPSLPEGLLVKPALIWKVPPQTVNSIRVSYLTSGFRWDTNYVMERVKDRCHLYGWVNLTNETGTTYENAQLKLIAGDVRRIREHNYYRSNNEFVVESSVDPVFDEKSFSDYHMYTLSEPVTIKNNQSKQIQLFVANDVTCESYYDCNTGSSKARIALLLNNKKEDGLGLPLPRGKVKVYRRDTADDQLEFVGEDEIIHTAKNETIVLYLGQAFDINLNHQVVERKKSAGKILEKHLVWIRNHKGEEAKILLRHWVDSKIYKVKHTSHTIDDQSYRELNWHLNVLPASSINLEFTLEIDESITRGD